MAFPIFLILVVYGFSTKGHNFCLSFRFNVGAFMAAIDIETMAWAPSGQVAHSRLREIS